MGGKVIPLEVDDKRVEEEEKDGGTALAFVAESANVAAVATEVVEVVKKSLRSMVLLIPSSLSC